MMLFLKSDRMGLLIATGCLAAVSLASIWAAAKRRGTTPELRSFLLTLAVWTGLAGGLSLVAALTV
jgi:hypothetical protein